MIRLQDVTRTLLKMLMEIFLVKMIRIVLKVRTGGWMDNAVRGKKLHSENVKNLEEREGNKLTFE